MSKVRPNVLELPIAERGLTALKAAVKKVIVEHARQGLPIYIGRDGVMARWWKSPLMNCGRKRPS